MSENKLNGRNPSRKMRLQTLKSQASDMATSRPTKGKDGGAEKGKQTGDDVVFHDLEKAWVCKLCST